MAELQKCPDGGSHTGAIAGNDAVYAVFNAYGVHRVADMDEMAATLALFDLPRKPARGQLGTIHDSGGERELIADLAEEFGIEFATLQPTTCALAARLEPGLVAENPLDAFGTHNDLENRLAALIATLVNDPNVVGLSCQIRVTDMNMPKAIAGPL